MKTVKPCLSKTFSFIFIYSLIFLNYSCSHKFVKLDQDLSSNIIEQVLKIRIISSERTERLTVYSQIDRQNKKAILNGVGRFDRHVFTLTVWGENYEMQDHINNKVESGNLGYFSIVPLSPDSIFKKLDINNEQPLIVEDNNTGTILEVTVLEQNKPQ